MRIKMFIAISVALLLVATQCNTERTATPQIQANQGEVDGETENQDVALKELKDLSPVTLKESEKLRVVATTSILGDLVRNVGSPLIELTTMIPIGSDPHTFAPTPRDAATVADAHVVFINGLRLEEFLEELIKNAGGEARIVIISTGVKTREFGADERAGERKEETGPEQEQHNHQSGIDPHVWLSPANAIVMIHNIERALGQLDPANAETYEANAKAYIAQLEELDQWVREQIKSIPPENREMITDHDSFGYYADRYGLQIVGAVIPAYSTNAEPSAQEVARLQDTMSQYQVKAVFVGNTVNSALAEQVAQDFGIQLVPLHTGSLGEPGSGAETYIDFIRYNTQAIVEALK